ncbi:MAG: hypothetical protein KDD45_06435 [Bdellovibrionales bacterium]|nr:hypothetical protein [Bdellovibrionales bacterium]
MVIRTLGIIFVAQLITSILVKFIFTLNAASFAIGGAISYINFVALAILWRVIIYKKRVAPAVIIVVIKYGILLYLLTKVIKISWINNNDLIYGVLVGPIALVIGGFFLSNKSKD